MPKLLFRIILILMLVVGSTLGNMGTYNGDCCVPPPTSPSPQMCNSDPGQPTLRVLACSGCSSNYPNGSTPSPQVCNSDPVSLHCVCWHALDVPLTTPFPQVCNSDPGSLHCVCWHALDVPLTTPSPQVCNSDPGSLHCVCWHALDVPLTTQSLHCVCWQPSECRTV